MSTKRPSPLVGYNTGVRYRGVPYHVQTEDSGVDHPHVITHLFAEGGHIIATRKSSYAEHVGTPAYPEIVRQTIRAQHKEMIVALRDGAYDDVLGLTSNVPQASGQIEIAPCTGVEPPGAARSSPMTAPPLPATPSPRLATRRIARASFSGLEDARDSLDEIIIADLLDD